jgi:glycosyltransferase involved in cell wall biosynthesis
MPFANLRQARTNVLARNTGTNPGMARYAINELFSALIAPLRGKVDIYHPTLYRALPWVRRRRIVVTHHDCIHERFPQLFSNAASIVDTKRKLFAQADAILCVSASSQKDLLHFYDVAEDKTHVIPHGFSPLRVEPGEKEPTRTEETGAPYLLYVGSRAGYKNFGLLLDAFSRSGLAESYRLLAVGGGAFSAEEQERIASLGLSRSKGQRYRARSRLPQRRAIHLSQSLRGLRLSSARSDEHGLSRTGQSNILAARGLRRCRVLL